MNRARVQKLGRGLFRQSLEPYIVKERKNTLIFGLDSEFVETDNGNELICWQLCLGDEKKLFTDKLSWDSLYDASMAMAKEAGYKATGIATLVYSVFFSAAECQWLDWLACRVEILGAHNASLKYKQGSRVMYVYDLASWFPHQKLKEVAKTFGLKKLTYGVKHLSKANLKDSKFIEYAKNDAYITWAILTKLREAELKDSGIDILLTRTPSGTASADFRHKYITKHYGQFDTTLRRRNLWASWGGRKEVFYRGSKDNVYFYDAPSFYPNCAKLMGELPLEDDWRLETDIDKWLQAKGGFGTVIFKYPDDTFYPSLPVLINNKLCFPLEGVSDCTTWEAKLAKEQGATLILSEGFCYNKGVNWLPEYLADLISKRNDTKDNTLGLLYKLKANAIIGKLTQKKLAYDANEVIKYAREEELTPAFVYTCLGLPIKERLSTGSLYYPEWHTLILGYARAIVSKLIIQSKALQVATDGVFTELYLGQSVTIDGITFDLQGTEHYKAYRPGLYQWGKIIKHQGLSLEQAQLALRSNKESIKVSHRYITSFRQALRSNEPLGKVNHEKRLVRLAYDGKRIVKGDGWTMPLPNTDYILLTQGDS